MLEYRYGNVVQMLSRASLLMRWDDSHIKVRQVYLLLFTRCFHTQVILYACHKFLGLCGTAFHKEPQFFCTIRHFGRLFNTLWGTVRNVYRERPTLKMTPPTKFQNFGILEEFWWRKQVFSSNRLRILRKSIWGVVKWEGQNGTWTPLTEIAAIWVVWDLDTNGFLLLFPHIHSKKYICQSHYKMSI